MSLLDRLEVPEAQSRASTSPTVRPRVTASSAHPAPTTPPPTTSTSSSSRAISAKARVRDSGERPMGIMRSLHLDPPEGALDRLLPPGVAGLPLLLGPLRLPALGLVPVGAQLVGVPPEADGEPGRVRGAERRR